jgi:hypothetical protein
MYLLVPEIVQKATQNNYFHFPHHIWDKYKMEIGPSRIQIWDPLQLNKSRPFIIISNMTTMSHKREIEYYKGCPESIRPF